MPADYLDNLDLESGLTLKQRWFCDHYLTHLNGARAYREAGYEIGNVAEARKRACDLLSQPDIRKYLDEKMRDRAARLAVTADSVLLELAIICHASVADYRINPDTGEVEVLPGVPQEALRAVCSKDSQSEITTHTTDISTTTEVLWKGKIKLLDKLKAANLLCKHLGVLSAELPPLEALLNRLPPNLANILGQLVANPERTPGVMVTIPPEELSDKDAKPTA